MGEAKNRGTYEERELQARLSKPIFDALSHNAYTLYYDESNNFRKLHLSDEYSNHCYLNSESNPFILGGLGFKHRTYDLEKIRNQQDILFKKLNKQPTQNEFKFKHVASGDLPSVLKSAKLKTLFIWLIENQIFIHAEILDVIYWSIIDILESETALKIYSHYFPPLIEDGTHALPLLKCLFYEMVQAYKEDFFTRLYELGYPDIHDANKLDLIQFLSDLANRYRNDQQINKNLIAIKLLDVFNLVLEAFKDKESDAFIFLGGEPKHELIKQFNVYYQVRVDSFPKSYHFFDEELEVIEAIEKVWKYRKDKNYEFIKSNSETFIQLSDVVIGFIRILFDFLIKVDFFEIEEFFTGLTNHQKECLVLFFEIYDYSVTECPYFLHYVVPLTLREKFEKLHFLSKQ